MTGGDPFAGVFENGNRPTAEQLLELIRRQGWAITIKDSRPVLSQQTPGGDKSIVVAVAGVLKREPYRSGILAALSETGPPPRPPPRPEPKPLPRVEEPKVEACRKCRAMVCGQEVMCGRGDCPYTRITRGDPIATGGVWKPWTS